MTEKKVHAQSILNGNIQKNRTGFYFRKNLLDIKINIQKRRNIIKKERRKREK